MPHLTSHKGFYKDPALDTRFLSSLVAPVIKIDNASLIDDCPLTDMHGLFASSAKKNVNDSLAVA